MSKVKMLSHRCDGVKKNETPIRYINPYEIADFTLSKKGWWLHKVETNFDYDSVYLQPITVVTYCPYCGENLEKIQPNKTYEETKREKEIAREK